MSSDCHFQQWPKANAQTVIQIIHKNNPSTPQLPETWQNHWATYGAVYGILCMVLSPSPKIPLQFFQLPSLFQISSLHQQTLPFSWSPIKYMFTWMNIFNIKLTDICNIRYNKIMIIQDEETSSLQGNLFSELSEKPHQKWNVYMSLVSNLRGFYKFQDE